MQITAPCVVSLTWKLQDTLGETIDELAAPVEFFYGGQDLLAKVEQALSGQTQGYTTTLHLEPEHAFGEYHAELVCFEPRSVFDDALEVGMQFDGLPPGSLTPNMPGDRVYTVTEVYPAHVVLDANHPLAGMALRLDLTVRDVRAATPQEAEAGSVETPVFTVMSAPAPGTALH
jgi:FKBP-type peptidyl-prolyl cis-trans isomerase SlyD